MEKSPLNEIVNIGSGYPSIFKNLIEFVASETNYTGKINSIEPTDFHKIVQVKNFYMNVNKLKRDLGFNEEIGIQSGLKQLL